MNASADSPAGSAIRVLRFNRVGRQIVGCPRRRAPVGLLTHLPEWITQIL